MNSHFQRRLLSSAICLATTAGSATVMAQSSTAGLEEIVITAQYVEENLQRSSLSVTSATGDTLINRGIVDTAGLAKLVPGITIAPNNAYTNYNIRGITSGGVNALSDTAIAVNYNGVSLAFPSSASGLYFDLQRVELVNGPQGILYGRNATAGAINVVANRPDLEGFDASVGLDLGTNSTINARGMLNIPVSDQSAIRIAAQTVNHGGWYSDGGSNQHDKAVRVSFLTEPTEDLSFLLIADYAASDDNGLGRTLETQCGTDFCFIDEKRTGLGDLMDNLVVARPQAYSDNYFWGITGTMEWHTDAGTLTVIPSYRRVSAHTVSNNASFGSLRAWDDPNQKSIEVRFASPQEGRFWYQAGVYGLIADVTGIGGGESTSNSTWSANFYGSKTTSYAPFAQVTFAVTDSLRLVGGLRYTTDKKTSDSSRYRMLNTIGPDVVFPMEPPVVGAGAQFLEALNEKEKWTSTTYKAGVEWDITDHNYMYFDVRSGFKAGGFFFAPPGSNTYDPEKLTAYSFGSKNRFFDDRLQANLEAFLYDYTGQQLGVNVTLNGQRVVTTQNVGHSKIRGVELSLDWLPLENTRLGGSVRWAKGDYDRLVYIQSTPKATSGNASTSLCVVTPAGTQYEWDCSGLGFPNLSRWAANVDVMQMFPMSDGGEIVAQANFRYQGPRDTSLQFTAGSRAAATKYMDANIQYRSASDKWDITAFVNNLINDRALVRAQATGANGIIFFTDVGAPRTYGVRMNYRY